MMNQFEIRENITSLLQKILDRSLQINHEPKAPLLEIDLLMDDLRELYRQYESLKSIYSSGPAQQDVAQPAAEQPEHHQDEAEAAENATIPEPEITAANVPPAVNLPQQEAGEPLAMEREPKAQHPASPPEEPSQQPLEEQQSPPPAREPQPEKSREEAPDAASGEQAPAEPQKPLNQPAEEGVTPPREPQKPIEQPPAEEPRPAQPVAPPQRPVTPPQEPIAKPAGPRAIIDLFSEPAETSIGDRFKKEDDSLHQKISRNKGDSSIGTKMQQSPVQDIRSAIGVNDKFLFINELFHGNIQSYNDAIGRLNDSENVQSAFEYLNELTRTYSWDEKRSADTIEKLANFVQRRYMKA